MPRIPSEKRYQEVVPEEFRQLQTDDVIIKRKKVERPFVGGHIWKGSQGDTLVTGTAALMDALSCRTLLTSEHALLLQHRVARVELDDTGKKGGGVSGETSTASRASHKASTHLLRREDDLVPAGLSRCLVGVGHVWNETKDGFMIFRLDTTSF